MSPTQTNWHRLPEEDREIVRLLTSEDYWLTVERNGWMHSPEVYEFLIETFLEIPMEGGPIVPFRLRLAQRSYLYELGTRDWMLKARRFGMTALMMAVNFVDAMTGYGVHVAIIAHKRTEDVLAEFRRKLSAFWNSWPEEIRPAADYDSKYVIDMRKTNCSFSILTPGGGTGRSIGFTRIHATEVAEWPEAQPTWTALMGTVPAGVKSRITVESTAKGAGGFFHDRYWRAKDGDDEFRAVFYGRDRDPRYTEEFLEAKRREIGNDDEFKQEYPGTDVEAFLAPGSCYFQGCDLVNVDIEPKNPVEGHRYVIPVDIGEGLPDGDWTVAPVIDCDTREQVGFWRDRVPPEEAAEIVHAMHELYNKALVAPERNNHGHAFILRAKQLGTRLYEHEEYNQKTRQKYRKPGWPTRGGGQDGNRDLMISTLRQYLTRDGFGNRPLAISELLILKEGTTFCRQKSGKVEANEGCHDDCVMAMAIGCMVMPKAMEEMKVRWL